MTMASPATELRAPTFDANPGGRWRGALVLPLVLLWAFGYMLFLVLWSIFAGNHLHRHRQGAIRAWGGVQLWLLGIKVEVIGEEHRLVDGPAILLFNHVTTLDLQVLSVTWTKDTSLVYKKEFRKIPLMGRLMRFFGMIEVNRGHREDAIRSIDAAAKQVRDQGLKLLIAPEGTRSGSGRLGPFKKGPFHMALQTRAPILISVMRGLEVLAPNNTMLVRSGHLQVEYLPPIPTTDWQRKTLTQHIASVRQVYLDALGQQD